MNAETNAKIDKPIVIHHYPCQDGFTAAWAVWLKHPDWEFYPAKHGNPLPDLTNRSEVYFVDFSPKATIVYDLLQQPTHPTKIVVLDHHKTAQADLANVQACDPAGLVLEVHFDMEKSGAMLAWEYFHVGEDVPDIVKFVEDRDLWRFALLDTKQVTAWLFAQDYDFDGWNYAEDTIQFELGNVLMAGQAILDKQAKDVLELSQFKFRAEVGGHMVWVVNVPYTLASDMGHLLCQGEPFAASYYYDGVKQKLVYSLRSDENGLDVSEIAKKFGGGGHKHAAGFERRIDEDIK
jgi:oligoribonuclease NrnB/cAMP/cGMP phosphodiesterase (DHH superfamily)